MKVIFLDKKFVVNKKVVVCIVEVLLHCNDLYLTVENAAVQSISRKRRDMNGQYPAYRSLCFKGIAKCKEGDTFDERTGKIIAEKRAMIKACSYYKKFIKECCKELENNLDRLNEYQRAFDNKENYLDAELTSYLMEV